MTMSKALDQPLKAEDTPMFLSKLKPALVLSLIVALNASAGEEGGKALCRRRDGRVQTTPAVHYLYANSETTFEKMAEFIKQTLATTEKASKEGKVRVAGPPMFVYKGATEDMSKPFSLDVGMVVGEEAKPVGQLKVRKTDEFKCATILFTGPVQHISKAYEKLMPAVTQAGYKPTGQSRELYLWWRTAVAE